MMNQSESEQVSQRTRSLKRSYKFLETLSKAYRCHRLSSILKPTPLKSPSRHPPTTMVSIRISLQSIGVHMEQRRILPE